MSGLRRRSWMIGMAGLALAGEAEAAPSRPRSVAEAVASATAGARSDTGRALGIYAFVRDQIEFGFTPRFDRASPAYTLRRRRGHCNPQATLMVAMLREAGLEARVHVVGISNAVLDGLFPIPLPERLDHAFTEIRLDGHWIRLDGYIADPPLLAGAQARLAREQRELGYGVHIHGRGDWNGIGDCMSQFVDPAMAVRDFGSMAELREHLDSPNYGQRLGVLGTIGLSAVVGRVNQTLDALRGTTPPG